MAINKVVYGNNVLVDLTEDTVSPENLQSGATAHSKSGALIRGTADMGGAAPCTVIAANAFNTAISYAVGDYCLYNGGFYRFTAPHSAGAWNASHVTQVTIGNELDAVNTKTNNIPVIDLKSIDGLVADSGKLRFDIQNNGDLLVTQLADKSSGNGGATLQVDRRIKRISFDVISENGSPNILVCSADLTTVIYSQYTRINVTGTYHFDAHIDETLTPSNQNISLLFWNASQQVAGGTYRITNFSYYTDENETSDSLTTLKKIYYEDYNAFEFTYNGTGNDWIRTGAVCPALDEKVSVEVKIKEVTNGIGRVFLELPSASSSAKKFIYYPTSVTQFTKPGTIRFTFIPGDIDEYTVTKGIYICVGNVSRDNVRFVIGSRIVGVMDSNNNDEELIVGNELKRLNDKNVSYTNVTKEHNYFYDSKYEGYFCTGWSNSSMLSDGRAHFYNPQVGNTWFYSTSKIPSGELYLGYKFTIDEFTMGTIAVYFMGKDSNDSNVWVSFEDVTAPGTYYGSFDLSHLAVYYNLDTSKPMYVSLANRGETEYIISDFKVDFVNTKYPDFIKENLSDTLMNIGDEMTELRAEVSKVSDIRLTSPSGDKYVIQISDDGTIQTTPVIPSKALFIGNSLLLGFSTFGMAASDKYHDYYHYVTEKIKETKPNASFDRVTGAPFESCTSIAAAQTWLDGTLRSYLSNDLELVVIQLSDNVNTAEKRAVFPETSKMLLRYIREYSPRARVAWYSAWYASSDNQKAIGDACFETGCLFVNITDTRTTAGQNVIGGVYDTDVIQNRSFNVDSYTLNRTTLICTVVFTVNGVQYTSEIPYISFVSYSGGLLVLSTQYDLITNAGVASHPGDLGMLAVANRICYSLGITASEDEIVGD